MEKWVVHQSDPNKASIKLTEFHELTIIHDDGQGVTLETTDQRTGDTVDVRQLDLEDLNCCMDPDEV